MGKREVAHHASRPRRVIEIVVLIVIILGMMLVIAELVANVFSELTESTTVSDTIQAPVLSTDNRSFGINSKVVSSISVSP